MPRREVWIAALFVLLVGAAVWSQLRPAPERVRATAPAPGLAVGEALDPDVVLQDLDGRPTRLADRWGERATVLYAFSTTCGCIPTLESDLAALREELGTEAGVAWLAIDGEPKDDAASIRAHQAEIGSDYEVLLDPTHRLCVLLGFDRAALAVVLDGDGYVRWRGNPTDRLHEPTRHDLATVLADVAAGRAPSVALREPTYGCAFTQALVDCPD